MRDDAKESHESWALIHASRVNGRSSDLFGTSVDHHSTVEIRIARAEEHRSTASSHYLDREQLIVVEMSPMQWAELITSMNVGCGVPCTIRRLHGKKVNGREHVTETVRIQNEYSEKLKDASAGLVKLQAEIREALSKSSASKKVQEQVDSAIGRFTRLFDDYMPFMQSMFVEACERTVAEAKAAVDAFVTTAIVSAGISNLSLGIEAKLLGHQPEDNPDSENQPEM